MGDQQDSDQKKMVLTQNNTSKLAKQIWFGLVDTNLELHHNTRHFQANTSDIWKSTGYL